MDSWSFMAQPAFRITPDCILDITAVHLREVETDRVSVMGARARARTPTLKVVVGYFDGYIGSGEITYAGINALARAKQGMELVKGRLQRRGFVYADFRVDLIGMNSLLGDDGTTPNAVPSEVRLRIAGRSDSCTAAEAVGAEVRSLHLHGPGSGGGGINHGAREVLAVKSVLLPRHLVKPEIVVEAMQ